MRPEECRNCGAREFIEQADTYVCAYCDSCYAKEADIVEIEVSFDDIDISSEQEEKPVTTVQKRKKNKWVVPFLCIFFGFFGIKTVYEETMLQHTFSDATCEKPRICTVCGLEDGEALGHESQNWKTIKEPTCAQKGVQEAVCSRCNQNVTREIDCIAHTPGEWEIKTHPTVQSDGVRVQKCSVCGEVAKEEKYSLTMGQKNAIRKAESYLRNLAFSREGLIHQLEFEGFSEEDAIFAVDNVKVDWNEECYEKAKSYLDIMSFSKSRLIDQLEYEGYTDEQIQYAIKKVGY